MLRILTLLLVVTVNTYAFHDNIDLQKKESISEIQKMIETTEQSYLIYEGAQGILINKEEYKVFSININEVRKSIDLVKKEKTLFRKNPFIHNQEKFEIEMAKLYTLLVSPIESKLEESINILPSPSLSEIPWNALKNGKNTYLIHQHNITIKRCIGKSKRSLLKKVRTLVFAPEFTGAAYLNNKAEKSIVTKQFKETETEMSKYDIIHISSHGSIDSSNWLDSGVYVGNEKVLQNREIISMCIDATLVFLNICNGGVTNEDGKGIVSAFQEAGAQTVVAALWEIEDQSAILISKNFYEKIATGEKPSEALRSALSTYQEEAELTSELNPFYWAGYQVYGENSEIIEEFTYNIKRIISLILSFLTSFSLIGYYFGNRIKGKLIEFNLV